jgi:hypothetical protein
MGNGALLWATGLSHWGLLSRRVLLSFESRYALRLFEVVSLRVGLAHKASEVFPLADLRARLGVPDGTFRLWADLRRYVIERAVCRDQPCQRPCRGLRSGQARQGGDGPVKLSVLLSTGALQFSWQPGSPPWPVEVDLGGEMTSHSTRGRRCP